MMTPVYLYRAYSAKSQGINKISFFAPKAAMNLAVPETYIAREDSGSEIEDLKAALKWKHTVDKFVFFTDSLLFAIAVANFRSLCGEHNVKIACIKVNRTRTSTGARAYFRSVQEVFSAHGDAGIKNEDGSLRDYFDVFITTDGFHTGRGSWTADFKSLEQNGLYDLYPALKVNSFKWKPPLHRLVRDAREYGFQQTVPLTPGAISTAAALASNFKLATEQSAYLPLHVLASLLAFQKRAPDDRSLKVWLRRHSDPVIDLDGDDSNLHGYSRRSKGSTKLPEVNEYFELMKLLRCHHVRIVVLTPSIRMREAEILQEQEAWQAWSVRKRQNFNQRRASRGDRGQPRSKKSYRRTHKRSRDDRLDMYATRHDSFVELSDTEEETMELDNTNDEVIELVDTDDEVVELDDMDNEAIETIPLPDSFSHQDRSSYEYRRNSRFNGRRERGDREYSSRRRDVFDGTRRKRRRY